MGLGVLGQMISKSDEVALPFQTVAILMTHSVAIGIVMGATTWVAARILQKSKNVETVDEKLNLLIGAANILFLCVGLTGIMLLVNNNLVRAFAAVSALALVRFRVKLDQKSLSISLLFAVLGGMACGLQEVMLAWMMIGFYVGLLTILLSAVVYIRRGTKVSSVEPVPAKLVFQKAEQ